MRDVFKIDGPARLSVSGGRTSMMMLKLVLDAHGGALPADVLVTFANTGKEKPQTYSFVNECSVRWGVKIHWLEYRPTFPFFAEVSYLTADRRGRPFEMMVEKEGYMPNPTQRLCTKNLKVKTQDRFAKVRGLANWIAVVGFRADEPTRVAKLRASIDAARAKSKTGNLGFGCVDVVTPLADAGISKDDVHDFWKAQPFDLALKPGDGNCDHCFLLAMDVRIDRLRRDPEGGDWWIGLEESRGVPFRSTTPSYRRLKQYALDQQHLPFGIDDGLPDCVCGD